MEIIYLKDKFSERDLKHITKDNIIKGITNYTIGYYEGYGYLIALGEDGLWRKYDVGHCSCYGPLEHGYTGKFTKDEIYKIINSIEIDEYNLKKIDKNKILKFIINN